MFKAT
jgi:choline-phosphate cytidylyltransferase